MQRESIKRLIEDEISATVVTVPNETDAVNLATRFAPTAIVVDRATGIGVKSLDCLLRHYDQRVKVVVLDESNNKFTVYCSQGKQTASCRNLINAISRSS